MSNPKSGREVKDYSLETHCEHGAPAVASIVRRYAATKTQGFLARARSYDDCNDIVVEALRWDIEQRR